MTCHVGEAGVIGVRGRPHDASAHAVLADARLATSLACARCHEFAFPDGGGALMQSTVSEHAGKDWSGSNRRGLRAPSVFSFYWTGVLATIQLMTTLIATFIAPVAAYFRTRPSRS